MFGKANRKLARAEALAEAAQKGAAERWAGGHQAIFMDSFRIYFALAL